MKKNLYEARKGQLLFVCHLFMVRYSVHTHQCDSFYLMCLLYPFSVKIK